MSIPNFNKKQSGSSIIEPAGVIEERKKAGLYPSTLIPSGAIICYDQALWDWISQLPDRLACDGWLKGSYLLEHNGLHNLVIKAAGFGAPTAVMTLEELVAYGITRFFNLGSAGGLQKQMQVGDIIVCDRAIRDEGTSYHYLPDDKYAYASEVLTSQLCREIENQSIRYSKGTSWTIDALYRETKEEFQLYRDEGVLTVEMEASALYAVGSFRKVDVTSVFVLSDILTDDGWKQGYHSFEKLSGLQKMFAVALEVLSINNRD